MLLKLPVFGAVFAQVISVAQAQTWIKVSPSSSGPSDFRGHSAVITDQKILVFGGFFLGERFDDLWVWSIQDSTWMSESFNNTPSARSGHSAVLDSNFSMWIFGGSLGTTGPFFSPSWVSNDLYYLDTEALLWVVVNASNAPSGRSGHSAVVDTEDRMWIFGGWGGPDDDYSFFDELYCFDMKDESWSLVAGGAGGPSPRFLHSASLVDVQIWIFGGCDGVSYFNDLYYFDLEALSWTLVDAGGDIPTARAEHSAVVDSVGGAIWIFGGWGWDTGLEEIYYLHLEAQVWTKINAANQVSSGGRYGHSAVVDESQRMWIYGYGGASYAGDWYYLELKTTTSTSSTSTTLSGTTSTSSTMTSSSSTRSISTSSSCTRTSTSSTFTTTSSSSSTSMTGTATFTTSSSKTSTSSTFTTTSSSSSTSMTGTATFTTSSSKSKAESTSVDPWQSLVVTDRLPACGGVPVLTSPAALLEIETMDEWEAEVEISPCLDAKPALLRWQYRCLQAPPASPCIWQELETLGDLDLRPSVVKLQPFTFQADTQHEIMVSASYEESFAAKSSLVFPLRVLPKRRPLAIIFGPHVVAETCDFTLSARDSRDVNVAGGSLQDGHFVYSWNLREADGLDVSHLLSDSGGVDLEIAAGTLPLGRYVVGLELRRAESNDSGQTEFQLFVGTQAMPMVWIESWWLPGDRVSTEESQNITAGWESLPNCSVGNLADWSWRWLLLEERTQHVVADVGPVTSDGHRLVMSTASFRDFAMKSGELYSYGVAGIPASFASYGFTDLFGLGLTLSKSYGFTADEPPGGGMVEARPCSVPSIAGPITYRTSDWQDEDPDGLEYAFYRFSAALLEPSSSDCGDHVAVPEIEWEDVTSPRYFRALGGFMLRAWAKSPILETLMPSGKFYIMVRARDSVGGKGQSRWMIGVSVGTAVMSAMEMSSLLQANVVTGDADRIFTSVEAILSMGSSDNGNAASRQAELVRALQVASTAMEASADSMEALAVVVGEVASMDRAGNETTVRAATSILRHILSLSEGTNVFRDQRVATSMFNTIGMITQNTREDVLGADAQGGGFQGEVRELALAVGDAMVSTMENESFASLSNSQMQLEVSKSKRLVSSAGCIGCAVDHIQKGRLQMDTETTMAGSRRLQGSEGNSSGPQTVIITAKLLVWKDFLVGDLDARRGSFNSIMPSRVDAIITEIDQDCGPGSKPLIDSVGSRHTWPSDPPAMTRTACAQFNESEGLWSEAPTEIYGKAMHVDCLSRPTCGAGVQRAVSTVLHVPDIWGTFADVMFLLWVCLLILCVSVIMAVTVILSVYKFETHVKHVARADAPGPRKRYSREEGPKAHAWSVVPAQMPGRCSHGSSSSESSEELVAPEPGNRAGSSSALLPSPPSSMAVRRPSAESLRHWASRRPSQASVTFAQGRGGGGTVSEYLGPLDSAPVSQAASQVEDMPSPTAEGTILGLPMMEDAPGTPPESLPSEEGVKANLSVLESWG